MDFSYSEEQRMLRDSIGKFIQNDYDFDTRMKLAKSDRGYSEDNWKLFSELGWLMVPFSESDGGLGGSAVDLMVVMEEFGKGLVLEPFLATAVLGGGLIAAAASDAQKAAVLPPLMEGKLQLAVAFAEPQSRYNPADVATQARRQGGDYCLNGGKTAVLNGASADRLIVAARTSGNRRDAEGISLFLVDAGSAGVERKGYRTQDGGRAAEVAFNDVMVPAANRLGVEGKVLPQVESVLDRAILAVCAEAVGAMEVAYRKTLEYAKTRVQFGVPIASFQALQHRMADMFIEHEQAKSILLMAAMALDSSGAGAGKAVSALKSRVGRAARLIGQEAVQIHGGIGVTNELDVAHYFKRLTVIELLFGTTDYHTQRFASL